MRWLAPALLLLTASCSAANAGDDQANVSLGADRSAAGRYRLHEGPDVASGLELSQDGRFRFFLSAGALDARAEGRWSSDGRRVMLDTEPRPTPATFGAGPVMRSSEAPLIVFVKGPDGRGLSSIDVRVGFADGRVVEGYTQDYGWHYTEAIPPGTPAWVELALGMYGVPARRFPLDAAAGNHFSFSFTPNDLGVVDFRAQLLDIAGRDLVMIRDGATSSFRREE